MCLMINAAGIRNEAGGLVTVICSAAAHFFLLTWNSHLALYNRFLSLVLSASCHLPRLWRQNATPT